MRTPCKCSRRNCRARRTTARHPDQYTRPPRCHVAGCDGFMRPDANRTRAQRTRHKDPALYKRAIGEVCHCAAAPGRDGRNMPHRAGSLVTCERYGVPF